MQYPKISIVTPSYNQGQFLEATIQSILSQNYPNLEYIIIDGGSTDNSVEIIQKYQEHLHFWCSEPDAGQYDAINKGFAHATGEIMAWLNSDDLYCPWALRTVSSIMSALPQVEWLTTFSPCFWDYDGFCMGFDKTSGYSKEAFLDGLYLPRKRVRAIKFIQQESTFWRRSLWEKSGSHISTEFKLAGDFDLWCRFYCCSELVGVGSSLGGFRFQASQKSQQIESYILESKQALKRVRKSSGWNSVSLKSTAFRLRLDEIPTLRILSKRLFGYTGKKVVRRNSNLPDGYWDIEEYKFPG